MPLPQNARLFEIKLSGIEGLMTRHFGDIDRTVSTPNLRVANQDNQDATSGTNRTMAQGVYNPFRRYGYLSAANGKFVAVQFNGANTRTLVSSSTVYDRENSEFYVAERGSAMWQGTSLDTVNLGSLTTLVSTNNVITDLEIYQVNGVRKIFYSYYATSDTVTGATATHNFTTSTYTHIANGTPVTFSASTGAVTAGTTYYVVNATDSAGVTVFQVSTTIGGSPVNVTNSSNTVNGYFGGIGIADLPWANETPQWLTLNVSGAQNIGAHSHIMVPDINYLWVLDGPSVHRIDGNAQTGGANGTFYPNIFYLPPNFNIVDGVDYRGNLYLGVQRYQSDIRGVSDLTETNSVFCGVIIWNKTPLLSSQATDFIPMPGIKEIRKLFVSPVGTVRAIAVTNENITVLMEYDGSKFKPIMEVGYNAYPEYIDGFAVGSNYVIWQGNDSFIYAYGSASPGDPEGLFKVGNFGYSPPGGFGGAIVFGGSNTNSTTSGYKPYRLGLVLFNNFSGLSRASQWDLYGTGSQGAASVLDSGNISTPVYYLTEVLGFTHYPSQLSTLNYIMLYMAPVTGTLTGNTAITVTLSLNQGLTTINYPITDTQLARGYYRMEVNQQYVNSIQLTITYDSTQTMGSNADVAFSTAVLVYEPTNTKG